MTMQNWLLIYKVNLLMWVRVNSYVEFSLERKETEIVWNRILEDYRANIKESKDLFIDLVFRSI